MENEKQTREELKEKIMEQLDELSLEELEKVAGGGLFDILKEWAKEGLEGDRLMNEEINKEKMDMDIELDLDLDLDELDQVAGGGLLADLKGLIARDGTANELKNILYTEGKAAAVKRCCAMYPGYCSVCAKAVSTL